MNVVSSLRLLSNPGAFSEPTLELRRTFAKKKRGGGVCAKVFCVLVSVFLGYVDLAK